MHYRRANTNNASYFFTVDLVNRKQRLLTENIHVLRQVIHAVKQLHLFNIQAIVILPEHLHTVWTLPENDADYPKRWSLIKANFRAAYPKQNA